MGGRKKGGKKVGKGSRFKAMMRDAKEKKGGRKKKDKEED